MMTGPHAQRQRLLETLSVFAKIGAMSYGGAAIMGIMQAEVQERRGWVSKERYLEGVALVNALPGAPATQLAIYIGCNRAGWLGGILAGLGFMLPAFFIMLALTLAYTAYGELPIVRDAFYGLGPVVLGIFVVAMCRLGKAALTAPPQVAIAAGAALLAALTPVGTAGTLLLAGCVGVAAYHSRAWGLRAGFVVALLIGAYHWTSSMPATHGITGGDAHAVSAAAPTLLDIASFFLHAGAFTFGGGITVLAFVQDQLVNHLHWLTPQEFLDGLALGQLAPGPVLMLAAYVGYKLSGIAGAVVGAFTIFLPSFVLILSVMPVLNRFRELTWIKAAMRAIGAAVIGVISVSLMHLAPHAAPDAFTLVLVALTVAGMLTWRWLPLPLILAGAVIGAVARLKLVQHLKEVI